MTGFSKTRDYKIVLCYNFICFTVGNQFCSRQQSVFLHSIISQYAAQSTFTQTDCVAVSKSSFVNVISHLLVMEVIPDTTGLVQDSFSDLICHETFCLKHL